MTILFNGRALTAWSHRGSSRVAVFAIAAAALLDLGLHRASDVIGGYHALAGAGVLAELGGESVDLGIGVLTDAGTAGRRWI